MKKAKVVRKTLREKLTEARLLAREEGFSCGFAEGAAAGRREFLPPCESREGILNFVRAVEGWPLNGDALVALVATDLKHICNMAVPARTMQVIASEMKKRLA